MTNFTPATDKQITFIKDLAAKDWEGRKGLGAYTEHEEEWNAHIETLKNEELESGIITRNFKFYFEESAAVKIVGEKAARRWTSKITEMNINKLSKEEASIIIDLLKSGGSIDIEEDDFDEWEANLPAVEIKAIVESQEISIEDPLSEDSESTIICEEKSFYSDFAFERELESLPAFGGEFVYNEAPIEDIKYYVSYFRVKHHCKRLPHQACTCEEEIQEKRANL